ncbi:MAG: hypothetical protein NVS2B14_00530 [Chamaesiphon sp.]
MSQSTVSNLSPMQNSVTYLQYLSQFFKSKTKSPTIFFLLTLGFIALFPRCVWAESAESAPPQLKNTLAQIDAAANSHQAQAVMQFYSSNFTDSDGLTRQDMQKALTQLWQRYPQLNYHTELQSWKMDGNGVVVETVTNMTGVQQKDGRNFKLDASLRSRQRFEGEKIVQQQIEAENTQLTSGAKPPTVEVSLPEQVRSGQEYTFDAIVKEPLGDDLLLGATLEQPVRTDAYLKPSSYNLQALAAGGIFKQGTAPVKQGSYWLSVVLVRAGGMTVVTRRLQVVNNSSSVSPNSSTLSSR